MLLSLRPVRRQLHSEKEEGALVCRAHLGELDSRTRPTAQKGAKHTQVPQEPTVWTCSGVWPVPALALTESLSLVKPHHGA